MVFDGKMRRTLLPLLAYSSIIVVTIFPSSFSSCRHWRCHALVLVKNPSVAVPFSLLGGRSSSSSSYAQQRSTFHRQHMTSSELSTSATTTATIAPAATPSSSAANTRATKRVGINSRGAKMNEIDFTLAPTDVSLSRCYQMSERNNSNNNNNNNAEDTATSPRTKSQITSQQSLSLTRALNTASNRAVRRILLSRSWPSAEALNVSLRAIAIQQQQQQRKEEAEKDGLLPYAANASRLVAAQQQQQQQQQQPTQVEANASSSTTIDKMKCPVPRPILNILMSRRAGGSGGGTNDSNIASATPGGDDNVSTTATATTSTMTQISTSEEREQQWVNNQIADFYNTYGGKSESSDASSGYNEAEAYLESILSLATTGIESERVVELYNGSQRTYIDAYKRILSVIQSVGAVLEEVEEGSTTTFSSFSRTRRRIAKKLIDQDFCLSMLDKIALANERKNKLFSKSSDDDASSRHISSCSSSNVNPFAIPYDAAARLEYDTNYKSNNKNSPFTTIMSFEEFKVMYEAQTVAMVMAKKKLRDESSENLSSINDVLKMNLSVSDVLKMNTNEVSIIDNTTAAKKKGKRWFKFWSRGKQSSAGQTMNINTNVELNNDVNDIVKPSSQSGPEIISIKPDDLGGVLLSAEEPTMTRQLNVLTNICHRTMIFGGDQEVLLLAETLDADKPAFIQRWYKTTDWDTTSTIMDIETRPGVQYLNSLIQLLRDCYTQGAVNDVTPTHPMITGYQNAYGRLIASLIELGSGYIRPPISSLSPLSAATEKYLTSTARPKSAREELGRLANFEKAIRKNSESPYPNDLVGIWNVQDVVGTQTIGSTEIIFKPQGELYVKPPMQGLRWRLDPGPTHLDTCTFQVLSDDGAVLQYTGFVDRGSRVEAQISKRSVTMRGGISFIIRDAEGTKGYWDDVVPLNYRSGTTKFIMSRIMLNSDSKNNNGKGNTLGLDYATASTAGLLQYALKCPPVQEGERQILYGSHGPILVTRVAGSYYAIDATCPHLNLPMKKGKITIDENGKPILNCSFHNSCFEMETGKCTKWVTGALSIENEVISDIMGSLGNEKKDITAYYVLEEEDGTLTVNSDSLRI